MAKANAISGEIEAAYHHYIEVFNREGRGRVCRLLRPPARHAQW